MASIGSAVESPLSTADSSVHGEGKSPAALRVDDPASPLSRTPPLGLGTSSSMSIRKHRRLADDLGDSNFMKLVDYLCVSQATVRGVPATCGTLGYSMMQKLACGAFGVGVG